MGFTKERYSNLELFRIITMLFIIAHHYVVNSGLMGSDGPLLSSPLLPKSIFFMLFGAWGKVGINCFVLITGFFMCKSSISLKKFLKLLLEIMFYKIIIACVFWLTGYTPFCIKDLLLLFIPIKALMQGFDSCFLVFYLSNPFLNIFINGLTERQHVFAIGLGSFVYILFGTVPIFAVNMNYVSWFMVLFLIASYIRLYPKKIYNNLKIWVIVFWVTIGISVSTIIYGAWLNSIGVNRFIYRYVIDSNTFLAVAVALSGFLVAKMSGFLKVGALMLLHQRH